MTVDPNSPCVVLLSGGLDSCTVMAWARSEGRKVHALSFSYGQRHEVELHCAKRQAQRMGAIAHEIIELSHLRSWAAPVSSLMADSSLPVPEYEAGPKIPSTYVPARNTLFLSYALALAECVQSDEIWLGVNALDFSGYPDCRPAFVQAFEAMANLATVRALSGQRFRVRAPLLHLGKAQIAQKAVELGVDLADTVSCYHPRLAADAKTVLACGVCDSCVLRKQGFEQAQLVDPTRYVESLDPSP